MSEHYPEQTQLITTEQQQAFIEAAYTKLPGVLPHEDRVKDAGFVKYQVNQATRLSIIGVVSTTPGSEGQPVAIVTESTAATYHTREILVETTYSVQGDQVEFFEENFYRDAPTNSWRLGFQAAPSDADKRLLAMTAEINHVTNTTDVVSLDLRRLQAQALTESGLDASHIDVEHEAPEIEAIRQRHNLGQIMAELAAEYDAGQAARAEFGMQQAFTGERFDHIMQLLGSLTPEQIVRP